MRDAVYTLSGRIDSPTVQRFVETLQNQIDDSCERLHILINSEGGNVSIALALAHLIMALPCKVITYNISNVDSAALIVFVAGEQRKCAHTGTFYLHPVSLEVSGVKTAKELRAMADVIDCDAMRLTEFLQCRTSVTSRVWMDRMDACERLSATDAVAIGLATEIDEPAIECGWQGISSFV